MNYVHQPYTCIFQDVLVLILLYIFLQPILLLNKVLRNHFHLL